MGESAEAARAALLPVGDDPRVPMRQIYEVFKGTLAPDRMLAAANSPSALFFANLYAGLYYDALGDRRLARDHLTIAAAPGYAAAGGYMHAVARLHLSRL